ncbi:MAG: SgcJ/EcaC family oxidoreductase [Ramlibacter sp.]
MIRRAVLAISVLALSGCAVHVGPSNDGPRREPCKQTSDEEIAALFDRWNASLQTGDPALVAANYAEDSILLPTVSNEPRLTNAEREDYFQHFLVDQPTGKIDMRRIYIGCNTAVDAGLYTFTFARTGAVVPARFTYTYRWDGERWLITSHHSSAMPEK